MKFSSLNECAMPITDEDIVEAMKKIPGYLDITPSDFMEVYQVAFDHALSRLRNAIHAEDIMTRTVIYVHEHTALPDAVRKMAEHNVSGLPVLKKDQTLSGVISEKDVLRQMTEDKNLSFMRIILQCLENSGCMAQGLKKRIASDIMTSPPVTVTARTRVFEIAGIMDRFNINRVPVVDEGFRVMGIIARSDIVKTMC
ncbi:MAG: CBS domain-containing protein [Desulfobacterales bacterium RIFOXYA12_FULL_46_15]|nr:MAG: CBS domain-containing protein [Desulfobacula sp. GWF2_41_7]OGR28312.1 MAG: CBS domain-containing protein [Desulfobacterales bacterium RIFOXYA12_FULL_46_15]